MATFPKGKVFEINATAEEVCVSPLFLHKIFQRLVRCGVLASQRGVRGGFSLARNASEISAREIIEIVQGPIVVNKCLHKNRRFKCNHAGDCSLREPLRALQDKFTGDLDKLTLRQLMHSNTDKK
jgi:Rrf2 family protein